MGGAIAMQALAVEPRLQCGVIMSTFATLHETMYDYMEQIFGIRWQWIGEPVMKKSEQIARFSIHDVAPERYAQKIYRPVLIIHGDSDEKIYLKYGERLYHALGTHDKQLKVIKGAKHLDVDAVGGDSLQTTIAEWMNSHLNQSR
jgi:esterase/lipase